MTDARMRVRFLLATQDSYPVVQRHTLE